MILVLKYCKFEDSCKLLAFRDAFCVKIRNNTVSILERRRRIPQLLDRIDPLSR